MYFPNRRIQQKNDDRIHLFVIVIHTKTFENIHLISTFIEVFCDFIYKDIVACFFLWNSLLLLLLIILTPQYFMKYISKIN